MINAGSTFGSLWTSLLQTVSKDLEEKRVRNLIIQMPNF